MRHKSGCSTYTNQVYILQRGVRRLVPHARAWKGIMVSLHMTIITLPCMGGSAELLSAHNIRHINGHCSIHETNSLYILQRGLREVEPTRTGMEGGASW
jgi:hypothetical protein